MYDFYDTAPKKVGIHVRSALGTTAISNPGSGEFKVLAIPPAIANGNPSVNWNNYSEVKARFNLTD